MKEIHRGTMKRTVIRMMRLTSARCSRNCRTRSRRRQARRSRGIRKLSTRPKGRPGKGRIRVPICGAIRPRLNLSMFTYLVIRRFLTSFLRTNILNRMESMTIRFTMCFCVLSRLFTVHLRSTVGIIRIFSTQCFTNNNVRRFNKRNLQRQIMAFLLPTQCRIVTILNGRTMRFKCFIKTILRINIRNCRSITLYLFRAARRYQQLPMITTRLGTPCLIQDLYLRLFSCLPKAINASIIRRGRFM